MNFNLTINCDSAAFEDNLEGELNRILLTVVSRIDHYHVPGFELPLRDVNGNNVGEAWVSEGSRG